MIEAEDIYPGNGYIQEACRKDLTLRTQHLQHTYLNALSLYFALKYIIIFLTNYLKDLSFRAIKNSIPGRICLLKADHIFKEKKLLVLTSATVGAGHRACPNEGNHRGIAPTKNGRQ